MIPKSLKRIMEASGVKSDDIDKFDRLARSDPAVYAFLNLLLAGRMGTFEFFIQLAVYQTAEIAQTKERFYDLLETAAGPACFRVEELQRFGKLIGGSEEAGDEG